MYIIMNKDILTLTYILVSIFYAHYGSLTQGDHLKRATIEPLYTMQLTDSKVEIVDFTLLLLRNFHCKIKFLLKKVYLEIDSYFLVHIS